MTFEYGFDPTMSLQQMGEALREVRMQDGPVLVVDNDKLWQATTSVRRYERWNQQRLDWDSIPQRLWQLPNDGPVEKWKYEWRDEK